MVTLGSSFGFHASGEKGPPRAEGKNKRSERAWGGGKSKKLSPKGILEKDGGKLKANEQDYNGRTWTILPQ